MNNYYKDGKRILAKVALGLPLTKRENAVYELFIKK